MGLDEGGIGIEDGGIGAGDGDADGLEIARGKAIAAGAVEQGDAGGALADEGFGRGDIEGGHSASSLSVVDNRLPGQPAHTHSSSGVDRDLL